jgi:hypothetical protein
VSRFVRLLTRYIEGEDEINNEVPFYIEQSLNPILRMPKWFRWNFIEQLELFTEHGTDRFHGLDLLNALTTPIFNSEEEHALLRPLARIESLTRGSAMFIGTLSL